MEISILRTLSLLFVALGLLGGAQAYAAKARIYEYLSQPGDSLRSIAQRFLVKPHDAQSLRKRNRLPDAGPVKPGSSIRIPIAAMRDEPAPAEVVAVHGPVTSNVGVITPGRVLAEGSQISTGDNGFVAIRLANGSMLKIQPNATLGFATLRQLVDTAGIPDYLIQLEAGRVEVEATNFAAATVRFQIRTPVAHVNVSRGTFRVAADAVAERALAEVVEGIENLQRNNKYKAEVLPSGFAAFADAATPPDGVEMLAAPDLADIKNAGYGAVARFQFPVLPAAKAYRAQVATDAAFTNVIASKTALKPDIEFQGLAEGRLFLRVRGIAADGLEGKDALLAFQSQVLSPAHALLSAPALPLAKPLPSAPALPLAKPLPSAPAFPLARPFPPAPALPLAKVLPSEQVLPPAPNLADVKNTGAGAAARFQFPALPAATAYRALVATDAAFANVIASTTALKPDIEFQGLPEGRLFLRVRGIAADGLEGPDALLAFQSQALPPAQQVSKTQRTAQLPTGQVVFDWTATPEATAYRLQVSRSDSFADLLVDQPLGMNTNFVFEKSLEAGDYFWRVAAANRAGELGAYSDARRFKVRRATAAMMTPEVHGGEVRVSWSGAVGEDYQFQLSRNERFTDIVVERLLNKPEVVVSDLSKNVYYMRVRQIERADGDNVTFTGAWSEVLQVEVYGSQWWLLLFGLPLL